MSLPRYDSYKDSGVEWIGEIPEGWEVKRLKRLAKILNGQDHKSVWDIDGEYPILGSGGIFGYANQCLHNGPSVLLGRKGTIDKPQYVENAFWSVDTAYFTAIYPENCPKFFYYLCTTINFDLHKYGSAVPSMTQEVLNQVPFPVPPLPEQTAIASFLDRKTAEIDQLIANKEKLIALYEEEKTAIINRAVTKGLDPAVKTRPSGVDWLGDIPEHWEVKRFKYLGTFINGYSFNSSDFTSSGVRVMKISNIQTMKLDWSDESFIEESFYDKYESFRVQKNDLVFALTRPIISTGIKAAIVDTDERILLNQRNSMFKATEAVHTKWMYYLILNKQFVQEFDKQIDKTGQQPNISSNDIAEISVPFPTASEQMEIIEHIETECARLDTIIARLKKQIELFKEYRTALISEVVTGKIDVRGEVTA